MLGSDRATSSGHGAEAQCLGTSFSRETHLVASWTTGDSLPRCRLVKGSVRAASDAVRSVHSAAVLFSPKVNFMNT